MEFDPVEHEEFVSKRKATLIKYETFDRFIDLALDGVISMPEAIKGFEELYPAPVEA